MLCINTDLEEECKWAVNVPPIHLVASFGETERQNEAAPLNI
jgi:hypothetical protein